MAPFPVGTTVWEDRRDKNGSISWNVLVANTPRYRYS